MPTKNLKTLKRAELQKLAKHHGVKANMKNDDIIAALSPIINNSFSDQEDSSVNISSQSSDVHTTADKQEIQNASVDSTSGKQKRKRGRAKKGAKNANLQNISSSSVESIPANLKIDLLSVKPPWDLDNSLSFGSTPDQSNDDKAKRQKRSLSSPRKKAPVLENGRRTRSSSRNRTPQSTVKTVQTITKKTFSLGKSRVLARVPVSEKKESPASTKRPLKRRSTAHTNDAVQVKRSRRSSSANRANDKEEVDEDLQKEIMDEIRKKVDEADAKAGLKPSDSAFTSQIPRFRATGVHVGVSKPITPGNKDWNKLHNKRFENFESIDDYERRKKERAERLLGSNQKNMVTISRLAQPAKRSGPKIVKPVVGKGRPKPSFMSPVGQRSARSGLKSPYSTTKLGSSRKTVAVTTKEKASTGKGFVPSVTSTKKMNLNFASKSSKIATPKRVTIVSDQPAKKSTAIKTPSVPSRITPGFTGRTTPHNSRKSSVTPFLAGNTSVTGSNTPSSTKRAAFDLKESLKKPLSWVPHKGPLRPYNDTTKKPSFKERMKEAKQPGGTARNKRKEKIVAEKKNAKDKRMMLRRGIK